MKLHDDSFFTIFIIYIIFISYILAQRENNYNYQKVNDYKSQAQYSELYEVQKDEFEYKNKLLEYTCLDSTVLPKNKQGKIHLISATNKQKVESFKKGKCPPIVIVPGYNGSKLDFRITNCTLFSKHHPEIMRTCGWSNCHSEELKKFTIWLNMDFDISEIMAVMMGGVINKNNKGKEKMHMPKILRSIKIENGVPIEYEFKEGCFGSLFRLYHKENINNNVQNSNENIYKTSTKENDLDDLNDKNEKINYKVEKLSGAEITIQATTREECGADTVSNILGNIFSISNSFKGFHNLNNHLLRMGYVKGLSLFNVPYDFRMDIDSIIAPVKRAIRTAYEINKKKVLLISHSFGGQISLKLSGYHKESDLVKHVLFIGSPFLGTNFAAISSFAKIQNWDYENKVNYLGIEATVKTKLDNHSVHMLTGSIPSLQFYPKAMINDEIDIIINNISEVEKKYIEKNFKNNSNDNSIIKKEIKENFIELINRQPYKEIIKTFYELFPKPYKSCLTIPIKNRNNFYNGVCKINMADYSENPIFKYNKKEIILKDILNKEHNDHGVNLFLEFFSKTIDIMNKYASEDFQIKNKEKYFQYLIENQEKTIFTEYKRNEKIEYSFVYSNHMNTIEFSEFEEINNKLIQKSHRFTNGDGTITGFSQIYPGLRWLIKDIKNGEQNNLQAKINFVEYCALKNNQKINKNQKQNNQNKINNNEKIKNDKNFYDKNKKFQHLTIKCDCMMSTNLDPNNNCNHSSMINDSHFINYILDIIIGSENKEYISELFKDLYDLEFYDRLKCGNMFPK